MPVHAQDNSTRAPWKILNVLASFTLFLCRMARIMLSNIMEGFFREEYIVHYETKYRTGKNL